MQYLTVKQVSELLQLSPSTVYSWAESGKIPSYKINGSIRFSREEIEEWIQKQKQPTDHTEGFGDVLHGKTSHTSFDEILRRTIEPTKHS
ncbi:hypothetical protein METP3_00468 [Methanosarcinales archaeon]|nr:hypothetical protein METP3_00468 [Methanosarcinales archaeon]